VKFSRISYFYPPISFLLSRTVDRQAPTSVQQCCVLLIAVVGHCAVNVTDQEGVGYGRSTPGTLPTELSGELRAAVERWADQQLDKPTLAEALRRLIEDGFATD